MRCIEIEGEKFDIVAFDSRCEFEKTQQKAIEIARIKATDNNDNWDYIRIENVENIDNDITIGKALYINDVRVVSLFWKKEKMGFVYVDSIPVFL